VRHRLHGRLQGQGSSELAISHWSMCHDPWSVSLTRPTMSRVDERRRKDGKGKGKALTCMAVRSL
jgi:hypothetical protein